MTSSQEWKGEGKSGWVAPKRETAIAALGLWLWVLSWCLMLPPAKENESKTLPLYPVAEETEQTLDGARVEFLSDLLLTQTSAAEAVARLCLGVSSWNCSSLCKCWVLGLGLLTWCCTAMGTLLWASNFAESCTWLLGRGFCIMLRSWCWPPRSLRWSTGWGDWNVAAL